MRNCVIIHPLHLELETARCIHERFYCNRRSAATTDLRSAGSPLEPSTYGWGPALFFLPPVPVLEVGQALPQTAEPVPWPSRAGFAPRLSDFATNRHESCGLMCVPVMPHQPKDERSAVVISSDIAKTDRRAIELTRITFNLWESGASCILADTPF